MHTKLTLALLAGLAAMPLSGYAQQCAAGYSSASITGRVSTVNVSETRQVGQICLVITTADGREVFDDCGALVGKVTATDLETGSSTLNHTALFDLTQSFVTEGDTARITGVLATDAEGAPCAMSVTEHMTKLNLGTGIFYGATVDVFAEGSISFCPGKNLNTFQLSGQGCVRNKRR